MTGPIRRRPTRAVALIAALLGLLAVPSPAAAGATVVEIREASVGVDSDVSLEVSVRGAGTVSPGDVVVTEGGEPVEADVRQLSESGTALEVVLVVDSSGSMKGAPLHAAIVSARHFLRALPDGTLVGVLSFSNRPRVVRPISPDLDGVRRGLGSIRAAGETALFDAVVRAAGMFGSGAQRSIVLLSDGADTASHARLRTAVAAGSGIDARIYTVALTSGENDEAALRRLASADGGFARAGAPQLDRVYQQIGADLSHQFLVTYRSESEPGKTVRVAVAAAGASDSAEVVFPASRPIEPSPTRPGSGQAIEPLSDRPWARIVVLALFFVAVLAIIVLLMEASVGARRKREMAARIGTPQLPEDSDPWGERTTPLPEQFVSAAEHLAEAGGLVSTLERKLERANSKLRPGEVVLGTVMASALGAALGGFVLRSPYPAVALALVLGVLPSMLLQIVGQRRMAAIQAQLPDVLMILASSLRAGHSFVQALDTVAKDIGEPSAGEFQRTLAEIRLGRPVEQAMTAMGDRVGSDDFNWIVMAVNIQREVGGNLAEILDTVSETLRERATLRRQVRVLSAEGRLSMYILIALPFAVGAFMAVANPDYFGLLFEDPLGQLFLGAGAVLMTVGIFVMRKMVRIDV